MPKRFIVELLWVVSTSVLLPAWAGALQNFGELEAILGDAIVLEDFEGPNLFGGSSIAVPNPLNTDTAPAQWNIEPGATYRSDRNLGLYTGQLLGGASNILGGVGALPGEDNTVTVQFQLRQAAVGFYLVNITGNLNYTETVTFYQGATVLGFMALTLPQASERFVGWHDPTGITAARVTSDSFALVDNVAWGVSVVPEPSTSALTLFGAAALCVLRASRRRALDRVAA